MLVSRRLAGLEASWARACSTATVLSLTPEESLFASRSHRHRSSRFGVRLGLSGGSGLSAVEDYSPTSSAHPSCPCLAESDSADTPAARRCDSERVFIDHCDGRTRWSAVRAVLKPSD